METLFAKVSPDAKAKVTGIAATLGVSQARAVELILRSVNLDDHGHPGFAMGELLISAQEDSPLPDAS